MVPVNISLASLRVEHSQGKVRFVSPSFDAKSTADDVLEGLDLSGMSIVVTGVSSGIGIETARSLVAHGAHVVGCARDLAKAKQATEHVSIDAERATGSFELLQLDLADLSCARSAADSLLDRGEKIDAIICNAGIMAPPFERTVDGFESQFGTNHLGHFVFVNRILPLLGDGGRIVVLGSSGHRYSDVDYDDPNFDSTPYDAWVAYGRSKTANILFAVALDQRLKSRDIRAAAVNPGGIQTGLTRYQDGGQMEAMVEQMNRELIAKGKEPFKHKTIPQGAATSVWAAITAPGELVGGRYCEDCQVSKIVPDDQPINSVNGGARAYALDSDNANTLWKLSEQLVGESYLSFDPA